MGPVRGRLGAGAPGRAGECERGRPQETAGLRSSDAGSPQGWSPKPQTQPLPFRSFRWSSTRATKRSGPHSPPRVLTMAPPGEPGGAARTTPRRIPRPKPASIERWPCFTTAPALAAAGLSHAGEGKGSQAKSAPGNTRHAFMLSPLIMHALSNLSGMHSEAPPRRPRLGMAACRHLVHKSLCQLGRAK